MQSMLAPPEILSALSFAVEPGSDPDLQPGTHLRVFAGLGPSSRLMREYLARNVVAELRDELREFLVGTCVLRRLTGGLCDRLLERTGSSDLLAELERSNVFTVALDDEGTYRYHEVLRSHLEGMLVEAVGAGAARARAHRGGELLEADGAIAEAVAAYSRAEDWAAVDRLLDRYGERLAAGSGPDGHPAPGAARAGSLADPRHRPAPPSRGALGAGGGRLRPRRGALSGRASPARPRDGSGSPSPPGSIPCPHPAPTGQARSGPRSSATRSSVAGRRRPGGGPPGGRARDAARGAGGRGASDPAPRGDEVAEGRVLAAGAAVAAGSPACWGPTLAPSWRPNGPSPPPSASTWAGWRASAVPRSRWPPPPRGGVRPLRRHRRARGRGARRRPLGGGPCGIGRGVVRARRAGGCRGAFESAATRFRALGAGSLEAWARAMAAIAQVRAGSPDARDAALVAEAVARSAGMTVLQAVAHRALAETDLGAWAELGTAADGLLADAGLVLPPDPREPDPASGDEAVGRRPLPHAPTGDAAARPLPAPEASSAPPAELRLFGAFSLAVAGRPIDLGA